MRFFFPSFFLKCPFHGKIIPRDDSGVPVNAEDRAREEKIKFEKQAAQPGLCLHSILKQIKIKKNTRQKWEIPVTYFAPNHILPFAFLLILICSSFAVVLAYEINMDTCVDRIRLTLHLCFISSGFLMFPAVLRQTSYSLCLKEHVYQG